jgi:hypothetical protein
MKDATRESREAGKGKRTRRVSPSSDDDDDDFFSGEVDLYTFGP